MIRKLALLLIPLFVLFVIGCEPPEKIKKLKEQEQREPVKKATEEVSKESDLQQEDKAMKEIFGEEYEKGKVKAKRLTDKDLAERDMLILARHILIMHEGARGANPEMTRTKEEAKAFAEKLEKQIKEEGASFTELAKKNSDCTTAPRGGMLGKVRKGKMAGEFEKPAFKLGVGEISGVVESPYGYHIIQRLEYEEITASHILLAYKGAARASPTITRTKADALKLAEEVLEKLNEREKFPDLATQYSDCPSAKKGGRLGLFARGRMVEEFENAAFNLNAGQHTDIVETTFGYHIILRTQ
jgi:parvulin-like peptidyl-prolyl isomerase